MTRLASSCLCIFLPELLGHEMYMSQLSSFLYMLFLWTFCMFCIVCFENLTHHLSSFVIKWSYLLFNILFYRHIVFSCHKLTQPWCPYRRKPSLYRGVIDLMYVEVWSKTCGSVLCWVQTDNGAAVAVTGTKCCTWKLQFYPILPSYETLSMITTVPLKLLWTKHQITNRKKINIINIIFAFV